MFLLTVGAYLHDFRRRVAARTALEDRHHQFTEGIAAAGQFRFLPGFVGIEKKQRFLLIKCFFHEADQIGFNFAGFFLINTVDGLVAGIGHLLRILGQLDLGNEVAVFAHDGSQFVYAAEGGAVFGGDQVCAHTPGGDGSALLLQALDQKLVQIVGGGNDGIRKTGFVQHPAGFLGQIGEVAAVQTDAVEGQGDACRAHFGKDADGVGNAGF